MDRQEKVLKPRLTNQQQIVLQGLADTFGDTLKISNGLCISETTIKTHLNQIFQRLGVNNRMEAVLVGYSEGLVKLKQPEKMNYNHNNVPIRDNGPICEVYSKLIEFFANIEAKLTEPLVPASDVLSLMDATIRLVRSKIMGRDNAG